MLLGSHKISEGEGSAIKEKLASGFLNLKFRWPLSSRGGGGAGGKGLNGPAPGGAAKKIPPIMARR